MIRNLNIYTFILFLVTSFAYSQNKLSTKIYFRDLANNSIPFAEINTKLNGVSNTYTSDLNGEVFLKYNYNDSCLIKINHLGALPLDTIVWVSKKVKKITIFLKEDPNVHLPDVPSNIRQH